MCVCRAFARMNVWDGAERLRDSVMRECCLMFS